MIMTVSPLEALNVLNGNASMLIRKRVPKGYVGWMWLVVSKNGYLVIDQNQRDDTKIEQARFLISTDKGLNNTSWKGHVNNKVVARYWHNEVETYYLERPLNLEITYRGIDNQHGCEYSKDIKKELLKKTNLTFSELFNLGHKRFDNQQSVINLITLNKLEILDTPLELGEFYRDWDRMDTDGYGRYVGMSDIGLFPLTKAPSTYQYVYTKEK